jgi:hypothetical protein
MLGWKESHGRRDESNAWRHFEGSFLVPLESPPSWGEDYFYVVNSFDLLAEPFDPMRCLRLDSREVRRSSKRVHIEGFPDRCILVTVGEALDTPSGYVEPWDVRVGTETYASLHPPPWLMFATSRGHGFVPYALQRVAPTLLAESKDLRRRQVERAMRSAPLLDHVRTVTGRRMTVRWFDGNDIWTQSTFASGAELFDALTDPATRNRPHLIHFTDGWFVNGANWLM